MHAFLRPVVTAVLLALLLPLGAVADRSERAETIRSNYTKFEVRIPMRDGVRLFTSIYVPNHPGQPWPFLMVRTPYRSSPYGADRYRNRLGPSSIFEQSGFIFVYQDVRGTYQSEGEFLNMRPHGGAVNESTDTWDTIEWLLKNVPNNNGRVGMWGNSYPGFYASAGMIDSHPALVAVSPQAPISDWYFDDFHRHGAFVLPMAFNFFSSFGQARDGLTTERPEGFDHGTPDGYQFFLDLGPLKNVNEKYFKGEISFWNDLVAHPNYDDFWQSRNILHHLSNISAAVLVVGGWYDTEDLYGPLNTYATIERQNPDIRNHLVMGPWIHGQWFRDSGENLGPIHFGWKTSDTFQKDVLLPFFEHYLKRAAPVEGSAGAPGAKGLEGYRIPEVSAFETGANRWRYFPSWPPAKAKEAHLYLREGGTLAFEPSEATGEEAADAYVSDPAKPVPYTQEVTNRWAKKFMVEDQRFAARRPDVLVYQSEVLEEDLTLAGPLEADLWVSTTGGDSDFVVKLIDVFPGEIPGYDPDSGEPNLGHYQRLVRYGVIRGRFRNSYETPEPFVPGEATRVQWTIEDAFHTFKKGHRIMIQVQSTFFPFIDRNPQSWVPNIFEAEEEDFVPVTNTVYRSADRASRIGVGILP